MCTAVSYQTKDHYFGRNLDLECSLNEAVTVTPRNCMLKFRCGEKMPSHYAMIGMACSAEGFPLYYDATNEKGLSIAGLNFPGNADYKPLAPDKDNIASFELIPWILGQCVSVSDAENLLAQINLWDEKFHPQLPATALHWIIADRERSIVLESLREGLKIYKNPVGILTNNPTFDQHLSNLSQYMHLSSRDPVNSFAAGLELKPHSRGMGALGLPGDVSSMSRFVRASFVKGNSVSGDSEEESVSQFFHILKSVEMQRGCVRLAPERYDITVYSSCCNTDRGIYYYSTYDNSQIHAVDLHRENLEEHKLIIYPLQKKQRILFQN